MSASIESPATRVAVEFFRIVSALAITCIAMFNPQILNANEPACNLICDQSAALKCTAEEMRDDLKCQMRGAERYAKMVVVNARIKTRSASIHRRVDRNPCYNGLDRDIRKLNELTRELVLLYDNAVSCSSCGCGKPICGCTASVAEKLAVMVALADGMRAASLGLVPVAAAEVEAFPFAEFNPNNEVESAVSSVVFETPVTIGEGNSSPILAGPKVDEPRPVAQSVLKR